MQSKAIIILFFVWVVFSAVPVFPVRAQDGGSVAPSVAPAETVSARVTTSSPFTTEPTGTFPLPDSTTQPPKTVGTTSTPTSIPTTPVAPGTEVHTPTSNQPITSEVDSVDDAVPVENSSGNTFIRVAIAGVLVLGGYGAYKLKTQKNDAKKNEDEKKDGKRCFDLKKLMEEKLEELTDIKNQLKTKAEGVARDHIKEAVKGTTTADVIVLVERAEKDYARLKQLYEKCMVEMEPHFMLLLDGAKGAGKTTISEILEKQMKGAVFLSLDKERRALSDQQKTRTELNKEAFQNIVTKSKESLRESKSVIIDCGLTEERVAELSELAAEEEIKIHKFHLRASYEVLLERVRARDNTKGKETDEARFQKIFGKVQSKEFCDFHIIETEKLKPEEVVDKIVEAVHTK